MIVFKLVVLLMAYTIGIATLSLQIICYLREIEYKETLFLTGAFFLHIIAFGLYEAQVFNTALKLHIYEFCIYFFTILLAVSVPINMHKERIVKKEIMKNRIIITTGGVLFITLVLGYVLNFQNTAQVIVVNFLILSVLYSMYIPMRTNPSLLIKHREKEEKQMAKLFMVIVPMYVITGILNEELKFTQADLFDGTIFISLIFILLAISKFRDDVKRLSLFSESVPVGVVENKKAEKFSFTAREEEVIHLLLNGYSYKRIAEDLFISLPTVKTHVSNIYKKTKVKNKVELINLLKN